jgi:glycosyltransferase involved in cell wall biosynthesis
MPRVTVVVASYQSERYIARAIESVLGQTLKDVEVVVKDDASTDGTVRIAESFARQGVRVCASTPRMGAVASFNSGIAAATAPLVVKLDADDWLLPEHLAECERVLSLNPDCAFVFTQAYSYQEGKVAGLYPDWWREDKVLDGRSFLLSVLKDRNPCASNTVMFRKSAFTQAGGFKDRGVFFPYGEDLDLWLRLSAQGSVAYLARPLAAYTARDCGLTAKLDSPLNRRQLRALAEAIDEITVSAVKSGVLHQEDWPAVARLLVRQWTRTADACAFLPDDWRYCLGRAWKLSPLATVRTRAFWRLMVKLALGLRRTEAVRARGKPSTP